MSLNDTHRVQLSQALNQLLQSLEQLTDKAIVTFGQALSVLDLGGMNWGVAELRDDSEGKRHGSMSGWQKSEKGLRIGLS